MNIILTNKKSKFNFIIKKKFEAGILLKGWEVKSIKNKKIKIENSYITIEKKEIFLKEALIQPIKSISKQTEVIKSRSRKLLLNKHEINYINEIIKKKKYTAIPLQIYWKKNKIKIEISIAQGKTKIDKRIKIKNEEWNKKKAGILKEKNKIFE